MKIVEADGVRHEFPDEATDADISKALSSLSGPPGSTNGAAQAPQAGTVQEALYNVARQIGPGHMLPPPGQLPMVGGMAGGVVPGPLGILTAGLGGGAGELGREALAGESISPQRIGQSAATQAAFQGAGLGLAKGAGLAGKVVMESAIGRGIPGVAKTALEEGIRTTRGGLERLKRRILLSGEQTMVHAAEAARAGHSFPASAVTRGTVPLVREAQGTALPSTTRRVVAKLNQQFIQDHSKPLSAPQLIRIRQSLDRIAEPIWKAVNQGKATMAQTTKAQWAKAMRDQIENLLHGIPEHGANIAASDARTAQLIRVKEAIMPTVKAFRPFLPSLVPGAIGGTIGAALPASSGQQRAVQTAAGALATSPASLSSLALLLADPAIAALLAQAPRGVAGALAPPDTTRAAR